jgi:hypothetical protein
MVFKNLVEAVDERLAAIAALLTGIEQGGGSADLHDLSQNLADAMRLFQRNPGIEAAASDLYAAAVALMMDASVGAQPMVRKRRLFHDAHNRFRTRLAGAAERVGPYEHLHVEIIPARYSRKAA